MKSGSGYATAIPAEIEARQITNEPIETYFENCAERDGITVKEYGMMRGNKRNTIR